MRIWAPKRSWSPSTPPGINSFRGFRHRGHAWFTAVTVSMRLREDTMKCFTSDSELNPIPPAIITPAQKFGGAARRQCHGVAIRSSQWLARRVLTKKRASCARISGAVRKSNEVEVRLGRRSKRFLKPGTAGGKGGTSKGAKGTDAGRGEQEIRASG
jgi:hypothetical protein